jgi:hypothetical protein
MHQKFWTGGADAYGKALNGQYREELDRLQGQLKSANTEAERLEIEQKIACLTENYREKLSAARRGMF